MNKQKYSFVRITSPGQWADPDEYKIINQWLNENIKYTVHRGYVSSQPIGVYLNPEDAIIFKLKFGL
jgi:hypothetical protein